MISIENEVVERTIGKMESYGLELVGYNHNTEKIDGTLDLVKIITSELNEVLSDSETMEKCNMNILCTHCGGKNLQPVKTVVIKGNDNTKNNEYECLSICGSTTEISTTIEIVPFTERIRDLSPLVSYECEQCENVSQFGLLFHKGEVFFRGRKI